MSFAGIVSFLCGLPDGGPWAILAQSTRMVAAEQQLGVALWIAAGGALIVFLLVLLFGRRGIAERDKLNVNWEKEEAKMLKLAELRKATRSPQERAASAVAVPVTQEEAQPASPDAGTPARPSEEEMDPLLRGLSD